MRAVLVLCLAGGCGRISFDALADAGDGDSGDGDAAPFVVTDGFGRPDGPIGPNWQDLYEEPMMIVGGRLVDPSGASYAGGYWKANAFAPDQFSQATVIDATGDDHEVDARMQGDGVLNRAYYYMFWVAPTGVVKIGYFSEDAAATKTINDFSAGVTVAKTAGSVMRIEVRGATVHGFINGVEVLTATDTTLAGGAPGLGVHATSQLGDWSGGNI
jgi:hypothetical protein